MARLRGPDGCPWDREQDHQSIRPQLIEECYELVEAIDQLDDEAMREELGDVLLHVMFHSRLAEERGAFDFEEVTRGVADKLVRRHPHVFGGESAQDSAAVLKRWDELKRREKPERASAVDGVPAVLPALMRAQEMQKKASKIGLDWREVRPILAQLKSEVEELEQVLDSPRAAADELGDVMFTVVNLARKLGLDAETCCRHAVEKFIRRVRYVEQVVTVSGRSWAEITAEELDQLWQKAKLDSDPSVGQ